MYPYSIGDYVTFNSYYATYFKSYKGRIIDINHRMGFQPYYITVVIDETGRPITYELIENQIAACNSAEHVHLKLADTIPDDWLENVTNHRLTRY